MNHLETKAKVERILDESGAEVQLLIKEVLLLEKENLHMTRPPRIVQEIVEKIKGLVK